MASRPISEGRYSTRTRPWARSTEARTIPRLFARAFSIVWTHEAQTIPSTGMSAEARAKGQEILDAEAHLALRFRHAHIDEPTLRGLLERIGTLRAELRFIHLRTHLETKALLTPEQVARYNAVRGYDGSGGSESQHKH